MKIAASMEGLMHCCGVLEIGGFRETGDYGYNEWEMTKKNIKDEATRISSLAVSTFINEPECQEAYKKLTRWFKVLYQSPPKLSEKHGNSIVLVIFDVKGRKPVGYRTPKWPFKDVK